MSQSQGDRPNPPSRASLTWESVPQPLRVLAYLLIALVGVEIYHQANFLVSRVFDVVVLFVFAAIIALLLTPLIDRVEATPPIHGRRGLAVLVVNGLILLVLAGGITLLVPVVGRQFNDFKDEAPRLYSRATEFLSGFQGDFQRYGIAFDLRAAGSNPFGGQVFDNALRAAQGAVGAVVSLLLVVVISIYLEAQGRQLVAAVRRLFHAHQEQVDFFFVATGTTVAAYVRGQLLMALMMAVYMGLALTIFGVHYAFVIAGAVFVLEFLPLVGAPVGMALATLFGFLQSPTLGLIALGIGLGGHALEAYIIGPRIAGKATKLHPLAAMVALLIGADVGGLLGALFAVPVAGVINVYLGAMYKASKGEEDAFALPDHRDATIEDLPRLGEEISEVTEEGMEADPLPHATADRPPRKRAPRKPASGKTSAGKTAGGVSRARPGRQPR